MNKKAALVGGIGLGAALMYLFDPDRGKRRRSLIRDKVESAANKTGDYAEKMSRDLRNRASGVMAEAKSIFTGEQGVKDVDHEFAVDADLEDEPLQGASGPFGGRPESATAGGL